MSKLTKKECLSLLQSNEEFGYVGVYDLGHRVDSRKMGIQYILELIQEMIDTPNAYKTIEIYYGGYGNVFNQIKHRKTDLDYFEYALYEMS